MTSPEHQNQPKGILDQHVSVFARVQDKVPLRRMPLGEVLEQIRGGTYAAAIAKLRASRSHLTDKDYRAAKAKLKSFTPCCTLRTRDQKVALADKLIACTNVVHLDIDHVQDLAGTRAHLEQEPSLAFCFVSTSGDGLKTGFAATGIVDAGTYKHAWHQVVRDLEARVPGLKASRDDQVSYLSALCFVSHDAHAYINPDAVPWVMAARPPDAEAPPPAMGQQQTSDFDPVEITRALTAIPSDNYNDWIAVGQDLHSTGHALAKGLWDWWSQRSTQFTQADQDYRWKSFTRDGGRTLGDLYTLAHQYGWRPAGWGQEHEKGNTSQIPRKFLRGISDDFDKDSCGEEAPQTNSSPTSHSSEWPTIAEEAFHGLAGEIVHTIRPHTEADPVALLIQLLTYFGVVSGRQAYHMVNATPHHANLYACLVGATSRGRKGSAFDLVQACVFPTDPAAFPWSYDHIIGGCGSGEGVIAAVRDPIIKPERVKENGQTPRYEMVEVDPGVRDKRLLIYEAEFSSVLKVTNRDSNLLSEVLRKFWETGTIRNTVKTTPLKATDAHVSLIGHITSEELQKTLTSTEAANGFANRILWVCVKRHGRLPEGGALDPQTMGALRTRFREAVRNTRGITEMKRDEAATLAWDAVWDDLTVDHPGLAGGLLARSEAQVLRLSMVYALMDGSATIRHEHLNAALALWQYVEQSVWYLFGTTLGDEAADTVLAALEQAKDGLSRNHLLTQTLRGHCRADELDRVLRLLETRGLVTLSQKRTGQRGRLTEVITRTACEVCEVFTTDYVALGNKRVTDAEIPRRTLRGLCEDFPQNGPEPPVEPPFVPDMTGVPPPGAAADLPEKGDNLPADVPLREPGDEDDFEEGDL